MTSHTITVGLAQIAPAWLDRKAGIEKIVEWVDRAGSENCDLVAFGEALLPGYPFWVERTEGARFDSALQKELYAHYVDQSVVPERGDLDPIRDAAKRNGCALYVGTMERAADRGGHSLYCSMVYIDKRGEIGSIHRKLMPTYEERLVWSPGDGNGLKTHSLGAFTVGGLNCWENWLPLARAAARFCRGAFLSLAAGAGLRRSAAALPSGPARAATSALRSRSCVVLAVIFAPRAFWI